LFDTQAFVNGAIHFLIAIGLAAAFLVAFQFIYQMITPQDERKLIREGNVAAALPFAGAIIGFALPVSSALSQTDNMVEFAAWAALAGIVQIVAFLIVRALVVKDVHARIERGEVATGIYLAAVAIAVGLINAASMTY
jgi:putative membrane protein